MFSVFVDRPSEVAFFCSFFFIGRISVFISDRFFFGFRPLEEAPSVLFYQLSAEG